MSDMNVERLILPVLLCAAMASCTVKEDRGPCPCVLDIHLGNSGEIADKVALSGWGEGAGRLFLDKVDPGQYRDTYSKKVEKGFLRVNAYCGNEVMTLRGDKLIIPEGKACDRVWAYKGAIVDATGESAEEHIVLHKQHAVIHVRVELPEGSESEVVLRAKGTANGFDISTLEPSRGAFSCFASLDRDMHHLVCVPRQYDDSLEFEVFLDGLLCRTVKAGELIANAGYSWTSEDLEDIYLSLSLFTPWEASVAVNGWDTEIKTFTY